MHHDLIVLGSGSGNTIVGPEFAGRSVAFVERGTFGGTCLNVGCIPTKMYVYPADLARAVRSEAARLGVDATLDGVRWRAIRDRVFGRVDAISDNGRSYRADSKDTTLYEATARFVGPRELRLDIGETLTGEQVVIATGSRPAIPQEVLNSGVEYHTSDTVMRIDDVPGRVVILGGGYIAAEFAHIFSAFGARTTVIARSAPLLRHLDDDVAQAFTAIAQQHWDVRLGRTVAGIAKDALGIHVTLDNDSVVSADLLLVATGRIPNTDALDPAAGGIETHTDGRIRVDEYQRTSAEGVWALGDVSSDYQLKHVANHEARVVQHNLLHRDDLMKADHRFVPAAVFTSPQLATVGLTEAEAAARGDYVVASQPYGSTAYGWAMDDHTAFCKLIADPATGLLLGAHLMGEQAATLIQPLIQAMSFGLGVKEMARDQYWIHPALTEVVENALLQLRLP